MSRSVQKFFLLTAVLLLLTVSACKNNKQQNKSQNQSTEQKDTQALKLDETVLIKFKNKVFGIPSPVLVSSMVKKMNLPYDPSLLNSIDNYTRYSGSFKQAVNLGVYSADLAYLNIYDQVSLFADYFNVVKELANNLDLLNVINQETLDRIEANSENIDSMMYLISTMLRDIDAYLTENDQQKIGALILAGGWVESVYFLTQLYKDNPSEALLQKIAEQKAPLNNLLHILEPYYGQDDKDLNALFESLAEISSYYDAIEMHYQYDQPEVYPDKHLTVIHSKTIVNVDDLDLEKITKKIQNLRHWLVS